MEPKREDLSLLGLNAMSLGNWFLMYKLCPLHLQGNLSMTNAEWPDYPEHEGDTILQNARNHLPSSTVSQPSRFESSSNTSVRT
jgi:hypothetical protein